jgi:glycosyltransferase involved in cell wall biosynthesis
MTLPQPPPARLDLVLWHVDRFPTAPGVYLGCLRRRGHRITWVTSQESDGYRVVEREEEGARFIEIHRVRDSGPGGPLGMLANRWRKLRGLFLKVGVMRRLAAERPDVLQVRDMMTEGMLAAHYGRRFGVPFAFYFDYPHEESSLRLMDEVGQRGPLRRAVLRWWIRRRENLLRRAQLLFVVSVTQEERVRTRLGVRPERIVRFPVGVSVEVFGLAAAEPPGPGSTAAAPTVCYLGNLTANRDPAFLFRIFEEVRRRLPEARFLLIGESNPEVQRLVLSFSAPAAVEVTGAVPHAEVPGCLRTAHVGVFPLPLDDPHGIFLTSSPLKVVEYLAAGLPVVSSRVPDAVALLSASGGGVCVENDPAAFAEAIAAYLRDPALTREHGARGREYVRRHRSFDVLADRVEQAYLNLRERGVPNLPGTGAART